MFYRFIKDTGEWQAGKEIHFPDGEKLKKTNKKEKDGFKWHDKPPKKYLEYQELLGSLPEMEDDSV